MEVNNIEYIINKLNEDKLKNCNMINFIENNKVHDVKIEGKSVLIKGTSDEDWIYISSSSKDELSKLLDKCCDEEYFVVLEDWILPYVSYEKEIDWKLSCLKLYFPEQSKVTYKSDVISYNITKLTVEDSQYIYDNSKYKEYTSIDYIEDRINRGIALGIRQDNELVAWIMTHDDGAIGFLNVLEDYRKKGYAYNLTMATIEELRKIGKIPFVHIEEDNEKSMNLALKTGFIKYGKIHWVKRKKEN